VSGLTALQAMAGGLYMLTMTIVGVRLLMLAKRNRTLPEILLGGSILIGGTLSASLEAAGMAAARDFEGGVVGALLLAGKLLSLIALTLQGLFIWRVFRPASRRAGVLVLATVDLALIAVVGYWLSGTFSTGVISEFWFCVELVARLIGPVWLVYESGRYYGLMRRRVRLQLADPVVANRFLLWAVASGFGILMFATSVPPVFFPNAPDLPMGIDLLVFGVSGIVASVLYSLAFFPPAAYRRRLRGSAPV
jgi:hypothetical protein